MIFCAILDEIHPWKHEIKAASIDFFDILGPSCKFNIDIKHEQL